jgi:hypothetical protein
MSDTPTAEKFYQLLPAFYRVEDAKQGEPLKGLLQVIAEQADVIEADISRLYRNWFIETCDEWVVPYIGELLGVRGIHPVSDTTYSKTTYSLRAFVANTMAYRRRKGTAAMLEQLARDITGWDARAVEFFKLLGTTQNINHVRLPNHRTPDLRRVNSLELLDTPFDTIAHTADVRRIKSGRGKHNIPNIGLFLWRLQAFPAIGSPAFSHGSRKFSFSILGNDIPLFNLPETEREITHLAEEINVPGLLRRLPLYEELEARRQALVDGQTPKYTYFDDRQDTKNPPVVEIFLDGSTAPVKAEGILVCNLEDWHLPPDKKTYQRLKSDGTYEKVERPIRAAVDPKLGRIAFPAAAAVSQVRVNYAYGFSSEVGGGWYERDFESDQNDMKPYKIGGKNPEYNTIKAAYQAWLGPGSPPQKSDILEINDSQVYEESLTIEIPANKTLEIRGADEEFPLLKINGAFKITGGSGAKLVLNGLRISAQPVIIGSGDLGFLEIKHCTLVPGLDIDGDSEPKFKDKVSLQADNGNIYLKVLIERCICGSIQLLPSHDLEVRESIIQGFDKPAIAGPNLVVAGSTVMGEVSVRKVELASNAIFTGTVTAELKQKGCVRFCYVPKNSQVPGRHRCQPDLAIKKQIEAAQKIQFPLPDTEKDKIEKSIRAWLRPVFTAENYGKPGFAQLDLNCPTEISQGAEDGSEMGVFHHVYQPQRVANLRANLDEYLPAGMEAGIFFAS